MVALPLRFPTDAQLRARRAVEFVDGDARYWALIGDAPAPETWEEAEKVAGSVSLDGYPPRSWQVVATVSRGAQ